MEASKVRPGDWLSIVSYMRVVERLPNDQFLVATDNGFEWVLPKDVLESLCTSANQFSRIVEVSRTELGTCCARTVA